MAKKVVATLKSSTTSTKTQTRCIKMVKSEKNNSYAFKTEMVLNERVKEFFEGK